MSCSTIIASPKYRYQLLLFSTLSCTNKKNTLVKFVIKEFNCYVKIRPCGKKSGIIKGCICLFGMFNVFRCFLRQREIRAQFNLPRREISNLHGNASLILEVKSRATPRSWRPLNFPIKIAGR